MLGAKQTTNKQKRSYIGIWFFCFFFLGQWWAWLVLSLRLHTGKTLMNISPMERKHESCSSIIHEFSYYYIFIYNTYGMLIFICLSYHIYIYTVYIIHYGILIFICLSLSFFWVCSNIGVVMYGVSLPTAYKNVSAFPYCIFTEALFFCICILSCAN